MSGRLSLLDSRHGLPLAVDSESATCFRFVLLKDGATATLS